MSSSNLEVLRSAYRYILNPPLFERVISFVCRDRLEPLARDLLRANLAVIESMTPNERQNPSFVSESQIDRIALGSGQTKRMVRTVIGGRKGPPYRLSK
ncbi:hypothetical protein [Roseimaritima ulvae]|uniref:hypothetical protein n=1 Tax=Roseimaritima ulvae TaxID=980254 RepID=UPI0009FC2CE6